MYGWMWEGLISRGEAAARWKGREQGGGCWGRRGGGSGVALSGIYGLQGAEHVNRQLMGNLRGVENSNVREPAFHSAPRPPLAAVCTQR